MGADPDLRHDRDGQLRQREHRDRVSTQAGSVTYTYDARDQLTSDGTSTYAYTANGDLTSVTGPSGTTTSTSDAYGQQGAQGTQNNTYDALGRDVQLTAGSVTTALAYEGTTGQTASDGTSSYTWTPDGTLTGTAPAAAPGVLDLTDHHTDLAAQFTPAGTTLTGSRTYGPWGAALASGGALTGSLGYQSQYTSPATGQVDMGARWYNPATGSFGNKDTVTNKPVPDSASASPFGYAADNPLGLTDPTGHCPVDVCGKRINNSTIGKGLAQINKAIKAAAAHKTAVKKAAAKIPSNCAGPGEMWARPMCQRAVYVASGGQLDNRGRPTGKGADPNIATQATRIVQDQYNAATKVVRKPTTSGSGPADSPYVGGRLCGSVAFRLDGGPCTVEKVGPDRPGGSVSFLAGLGDGLVQMAQSARCAGDTVGCLLDKLLGAPSLDSQYRSWLNSRGVDTSRGSTFTGGQVSFDLISLAAGGALGAAGAARAAAGASRAAVEGLGTGGPHVALGQVSARYIATVGDKEFDVIDRQWLETFARDQGAITYTDPLFDTIRETYKTPAAFASNLVDSVVQMGGRISFTLKGMDVEGALAGKYENSWTSAELRYIAGNPAARAITTFFHGTVPF